MSRFNPATRFLTGATAAAAALVTVLHGWPPDSAAPPQWMALGLLALAAAVAHLFPIRSAADGSTYRLTNIFLVAGAVVLPPGLQSLLPVLAITPDSLMRRNGPDALLRYIFNGSQAILAVHTAGGWLQFTGGRELASLGDLARMVVAAALFTAVQQLLVGLFLALKSGMPLHRAEPFTLPALLSDLMMGLLGIVVAGVWLANPILLLLFPPVLVVAHRLTRTAHMAQMAKVDLKTGLHNYRHFEQVLEQELRHAGRMGRSLALMFADMDLLRQVNNQYGHLAGDRVLQEVSALMARTLRSGDLLARFGGEEFVALLPGTDADGAAQLAEKVRQAVEEHPFVLDDGTVLRCTVSIGVAAFPQDAATMVELVKQADMAMYRAKQRRNATMRAGALPPVPRPPAAAAPAHPPAPGGDESPRWIRMCLTLMVAGGLAAILTSIVMVTRAGGWEEALPYLALAVVFAFLKVPVHDPTGWRVQFYIAFTTPLVMAAVISVPWAAPLVSLVSAMPRVWTERQRNPSRVLYHLCAGPLAAASAVMAYLALGPVPVAASGRFLAVAGGAALVQHGVNLAGFAVTVAHQDRRPVVRVAAEAIRFSPLLLSMGLLGAFWGPVQTTLGLVGSFIFLMPLGILRYVLALFARNSEQTISVLQTAKAEVEMAHREQEQALQNVIETLSSMIDARDKAVFGHSRQVARYAVALGRALGRSEAELATLHTAGLLHDLGKVAIPEAILHKPARLTAEEYEIIKRHPGVGERILAEVRPLAEVARMVGEHHERYDGSGYPAGLRGEEISMGGRILSVADALDSMLSDRPYARGRGLSAALAELHRCAGAQFDPQVVAALDRMVAELGPEFFTNSARPAGSDLLWSDVANRAG